MTESPRTLGSLVDDFVLAATIVLERKRVFSESGLSPPPLHADLIAEVEANPPRIHWPQSNPGIRHRVQVDLPAQGTGTYFDFFPAKTERADTLIVYHHGLGEIPHDIVPRVLRLSPTLRSRCDLIAVKGLHHETYPRISERLTADLHHFVRCLVCSASLVGAIAKAQRERYQHLVMCGMSMGGVISLIEASHDPSFDLYVPLISGPSLSDVVLHSGFSRCVQGRWLKGARRSDWHDALDVTGRLESPDGPPIRPLLAKSDRLFRVREQIEAYKRIPRARVAVCPGGHITAAVRIDVVARHILAAIHTECWTQSAASLPEAALTR